MAVHLKRRIDRIKKKILLLGGTVEEALRDAIRAVEERQPEIAERVIRGDRRVDAMEIELEEECLAVLALEQPVAFDLRFVVSVLKINNDLERIGDLAGNIAEQARFLASQERLDHLPFDLPRMERLVQAMLRQSLDALVHVDTDLAKIVAETDDLVDELYSEMFAEVEGAMHEEPRFLSQLIHILSIARMLERAADHAVNIAEDVLYMGDGIIHRHERRRRDASADSRKDNPSAA